MMHEIIEKIKRHENFSFSYSGITIFMQWCPPGSFIMGSSPDEIGHKSDEFQHRVNFSKGFWISRSLVSQKLYDAVMDYNPTAARWQDPNLPVESVTWNNAFEFCKKIDLFFKKNIANDLSLNHTFIMPSEAEWEYACRASESSTWNIGENILIEKGVDEALDSCGWYMKNADGRPQAVEKKNQTLGGFMICTVMFLNGAETGIRNILNILTPLPEKVGISSKFLQKKLLEVVHFIRFILCGKKC